MKRLDPSRAGLYVALRMKPSGKVNPVSVLLLLALVGAGWWAVIFVPVYLDNLDVREAVDAAFSRYHVEGEQRARQFLMDRLNVRTPQGTIGHHFELDEEGVERELPGLGVPEENVTFDYVERDSLLTVRVEYDRVVVLKPTQARRTLHFVVEKSGAAR
ncbi:MAG: hypothetical protein AB1730_05650 [Myxococcota bacterium]